jgi:hypothetical protein
LVDQIFFKSNVVGKQVRQEQFRDAVPLGEQIYHQRVLDPVKSAIAYAVRRGEAQRLAGKASLTEELIGVQNGDDRFLALVGRHCGFHVALVQMPHGIWNSLS